MHRLLQHPATRLLLTPALAVRRAVLDRKRHIGQRRFEHFRSLLAADPILRVDAFEGEFALSPTSDLLERLAWEGTYEPEMARVCLEHLDSRRDAVDVGANIGFFSVLMAKHLVGGRVLAIEPTGAAMERIRFNLVRNGVIDRVVLHHGAAGEAVGTLQLSLVDGKEEYASLGPVVHHAVDGVSARAVEVQVSTIDGMVEEHGMRPGFIKIDVEGAEMKVLQGALKTLEWHRPVVMLELSPLLLRAQGATADAVLGVLRDLDYEITDPLRPESPPHPERQSDVLAVPR